MSPPAEWRGPDVKWRVLKVIRQASLEELAELPGIGHQLAHQIKTVLQADPTPH